MHRGYDSERPEREPLMLDLAKGARKPGSSRTGISVYPDVPSASAACDATIPGDAHGSHGRRSSARFRVLKVTQSYYPFLERGGPAVKVRALAQGLARRGHPVTVLTSDLGITSAAKPAGEIARTSYGWQWDEDSVETHFLSARGSYRSLTWNPGIFGFCDKRLKSFDIVHIYGTYDLLGPIVARACRQSGIPYLIEPMGMFRPLVRNLALKWLYRRLLGESVARGAARLVATSLQERRELIEEGIAPEKITIRRNGIETPRLPEPGAFRRQWKIPQDAFLVLFLGRIVSKKSPELLLEAFARWRHSSGSTHPSILIFAGPPEDANYVQKLEEEVTRLGLGGAVLFTGALYGDVKWSALVDADIFVLPSQNENFGNAAAEAVVCGTPVIVTDRCGIAPLIEGRAGLVVAHQCEALVRALHQLSGAGLRERMKLGCRDVARGLGWEQPLTETEALYAELLSDPSAVRREPERARQRNPSAEHERKPQRKA
jgi:glycosyltransferase involved in cell wall biosynthesis